LNHIIYRMMQDYYFGNLMLGKLDLLSSQLGLEPRCPYTESKYAHFVYNIPAKFKQKDGTVKYFFKKAIDGILPDSIIYRPKQGFRTPVVELFRGPLGDWGKAALLDGGLTRTGFLRRDTLARLYEEHRTGGDAVDHSNRLWTVLMLNLWHRRWIESPRPTKRTDREAGSAVVA
jgi:asparagine synthase (glutamine-hydrolysing)